MFDTTMSNSFLRLIVVLLGELGTTLAGVALVSSLGDLAAVGATWLEGLLVRAG